MAVHNAIIRLPFPLFSLPKFRNPSSTIHCGRQLNRFKPFAMQFRNGSAVSSSSLPAIGEDLPFDYTNWFPKADPSKRRRAGILLHPTSFPGPYDIGDLGEQAFRFIDWLHDAGCSLWKVLPLVPPGRRANEEGEEEIRISSLTDDLIYHILSFT